MKIQYFGLTDISKRPFEMSILKGTKEQVDVFQSIMFSGRDMRVESYGEENPKLMHIVILDNLTFICDTVADVNVFECSHANEYLFSGYQDKKTNDLVILEEERITRSKISVESMCLFSGFKHYAVCENCENEGSWNVGEGPETKVVSCECPNVIFSYE